MRPGGVVQEEDKLSKWNINSSSSSLLTVFYCDSLYIKICRYILIMRPIFYTRKNILTSVFFLSFATLLVPPTHHKNGMQKLTANRKVR